jgi:hypothetical protein
MNKYYYILILAIFSSCSSLKKYSIKPEYSYLDYKKVKEITVYKHTYLYEDDLSRSTKDKYVNKGSSELYDKFGQLIESTDYGEIVRTRTFSEDGKMISSGHGVISQNINTKTFYLYEGERLSSSETWGYKNNLKERLIKEIYYEYKDSLLFKSIELDRNHDTISTTTYNEFGDKLNQNKIRTQYEPSLSISGISTDSTTYDSIGRATERYHYYDGKFLRRTKWIYDDISSIITEYKYDDDPNSLWCYTETRYDYLSKKPLRIFWKVLNSTTETKTLFEYEGRRVKKEIHYSVDIYGRDVLEYYLEYEYSYF